jgi:hypothetical protein
MGLTVWTIGSWSAYLGFPATPDEYGCTWWATQEDGWRTPPAPRIERTVRPRQHGEVDPGRVWLPARTMELRGLVEAPDHDALAAAGDRFGALLADGTLSTLLVDEDERVLSAQTRLADAPTFTLVHPRLATWVLPLLMPDPLRYSAGNGDGGETSATTGLPEAEVGLPVPAAVPWVIFEGGTSGRLVMENFGTAPTKPTFRITGPVVNPRIEHATSGRVLSFSTTLGATDTIDVYPATGEVLLNGSVNARSYLATGSSPVTAISFPPGVNEIYYRALSSPGDSSMTVTFQSAYF